MKDETHDVEDAEQDELDEDDEKGEPENSIEGGNDTSDNT